MRVEVFGRYFRDLAAGDPVALGVTGVFVLFLLVVGAVWIKVVLDQRREEKERKAKFNKLYRPRHGTEERGTKRGRHP